MSTHFEAQFPDAAEAMERLDKLGPVEQLEAAALECGRCLITYSHLERTLRAVWAKGLLKACGNNASLASREAHIHRNTLSKMLHALDSPEP